MSDFLMKYKEIINSWESIAFIFAVLFAIALFIFFVYYRYQKLKEELSSQMLLFNSNIFFKDRLFFESYKDRKELDRRDFIKISKNNPFMEHLRHKEVNYYTEIIKIAKNLKHIRNFEIFNLLLFGFFLILGSVVSAPHLKTLWDAAHVQLTAP